MNSGGSIVALAHMVEEGLAKMTTATWLTALLVLVMPGLSADMTAVAATMAATGAIIFGAMYMPWNRA